MIQMMVDDVYASADLVLAMRPPNVMRTGKAPVVAVCGIPAFGVANIGEARNRKEGYATAAQVGAVVSPGKPQNIRSYVRTKIRGLAIFAHPRKTHVAVDHERRRKGQGVAHCDELDKFMK